MTGQQAGSGRLTGDQSGGRDIAAAPGPAVAETAETGSGGDAGYLAFRQWVLDAKARDWRDVARVVAWAIDRLPVGTSFVAGPWCETRHTKVEEQHWQSEVVSRRVLQRGPRRGKTVEERSVSRGFGGWNFGVSVAFDDPARLDERLLQVVYRTLRDEDALPRACRARPTLPPIRSGSRGAVDQASTLGELKQLSAGELLSRLRSTLSALGDPATVRTERFGLECGLAAGRQALSERGIRRPAWLAPDRTGPGFTADRLDRRRRDRGRG